MRDEFGFGFAGPKQETATNGAQDANFKGTYVSTNRYYGYQPLNQKEPEAEEYMDVQISDSGIQFNNFIAPEDRLGGLREGNINITRGPVNRKRRWSDDAPQFKFKKRRESVRHAHSERKCTQATLEKHKVDDELLEQLLRETHGCSVYHWTSDCLVGESN